MLLALVIVLSILLVFSLFIIHILALGVGAWDGYMKENHLEQPSGEELKRLARKYTERRRGR